MLWRKLLQHLGLLAPLARIGAAGGKPAAGLGVDWGGKLPGKLDSCGLIINICGRNSRQKCLRIGVQLQIEQFL